MLKKLLKYDLNSTYKFLIIFYSLALLFSITTRILFSLEKTTIISILGSISSGCLIAMIANIIINNLMRNWVRFKETMYGDESYLTHTLPVSKKTLYLSKFILSLITLITSFIVIIITIFIAYYTKDKMTIIKNLISSISPNYNFNIPLFIISLIFIFYLEMFSILQSGYLGIILGHKKNNNKVLFSIIYSFVIYMLSQMFVLLVVFIFGLFNNDIMSLFTSNIISGNLIKFLIILSSLIYIVIIFIIKLICEKELEKGVNVI